MRVGFFVITVHELLCRQLVLRDFLAFSRKRPGTFDRLGGLTHGFGDVVNMQIFKHMNAQLASCGDVYVTVVVKVARDDLRANGCRPVDGERDTCELRVVGTTANACGCQLRT